MNLMFSVGNYFFTKNESYQKYLDGEYYFIYEAETVIPGDPNYTVMPDDPMFYADYSDPRNMLLINRMSVRVYNAHDYYCTVIYGDNVIEEFPLSHIKVSDEDYPYFYGMKQYTEEEYFNKLGSLSGDKKSYSLYISDRDMISYKSVGNCLYVLLGFDVIAAVVFFIITNTDSRSPYADIILLAGAGFSLIFSFVGFWTR